MSTGSRFNWMHAFLAACTLGLATSFVDSQKADTPVAEKRLDDKFAEILGRLEQAEKVFRARVKDADAKSLAEVEKLKAERPGATFIPEFQALAREAKGTELAANVWLRVISVAVDVRRNDEAKEALDVLMSQHLSSPALEVLPDLALLKLAPVIGKDKAEELVRSLVEKSPHKAVQAGALYSLSSSILRENNAAPERTAEARKLMERIQKDFAGVQSSHKKEYAVLAEAALFQLDHLQIGKLAPDFEVTDENGVKFKLSDYRGRVVVIDFWGNW